MARGLKDLEFNLTQRQALTVHERVNLEVSQTGSS